MHTMGMGGGGKPKVLPRRWGHRGQSPIFIAFLHTMSGAERTVYNTTPNKNTTTTTLSSTNISQQHHQQHVHGRPFRDLERLVFGVRVVAGLGNLSGEVLGGPWPRSGSHTCITCKRAANEAPPCVMASRADCAGNLERGGAARTHRGHA